MRSGRSSVLAARAPQVDFEPADLRRADEPGRAVDHQVFGGLAVSLLDRHRLQRGRHALHRVLLEEALLAGAIGTANEAQGPAADVRQHALAHRDEVLGEALLGDAGLGEQHLVGMRQAHALYIVVLRGTFRHGYDRLRLHVLGGLVAAQPQVGRVAQPSVRRLLRIGDLCHETRLDPAGVTPDVAGSVDERARRPLQPRQALAEIVQQLGIEARPDAPAIVQLVADVLAQQQRGERAPLLVGSPVAADDELVVARALALEPALGALREIGLVGALRDDAFKAHVAGFGEHLVAVADDVLAVDDAFGWRPQQRVQELFAPDQRLLAQIAAIELE